MRYDISFELIGDRDLVGGTHSGALDLDRVLFPFLYLTFQFNKRQRPSKEVTVKVLYIHIQ